MILRGQMGSNVCNLCVICGKLLCIFLLSYTVLSYKSRISQMIPALTSRSVPTQEDVHSNLCVPHSFQSTPSAHV